ncbi:hypothetical protein KAI58_04680 [Candidatus Gracilibacteria bacterium]|nr:hypothetical protein [Candidatus Gracilibacteria bacterium]
MLKIIAENQTLLLGVEQNRLKEEKRKFWLKVGGFVFWIIMIWISFVFTQTLMGDLMGSGSGDGFNISNLLQGGLDPEMQEELNRYLQ